MKAPYITPRMKAFVSLAKPNMEYWDLCCDHGYIGIHALLSGKFTKVHFVDQVPHILDRLQELFQKSPYKINSNKYGLYIEDIRRLDRQMNGNVLIAGVGGALIRDALSMWNTNQSLVAERYILSPHSEEAITKSFLNDLEGYTLNAEHKLEENGRERLIFVLDRNVTN